MYPNDQDEEWVELNLWMIRLWELRNILNWFLKTNPPHIPDAPEGYYGRQFGKRLGSNEAFSSRSEASASSARVQGKLHVQARRARPADRGTSSKKKSPRKAPRISGAVR